MRLLLSSGVCLLLLLAAATARPDGSYYFPDALAEHQIGDSIIPLEGRRPPGESPYIRSILWNNLVRSNYQIYHNQGAGGRPGRPVIREHERRV